MNIVMWIIFGALAGWLATMIVGKDSRYGAIANIGIGIAGAIIGGFISSFIGFGSVSGFNLGSLIVAVAGATLLLMVIGAMENKHRSTY